MTNRLIGLLIIFIFLIAGIGFYYLGKEEQITKNIQKNSIEKKITNKKSITLTEVKTIENKKIIKDNTGTLDKQKQKSIFELSEKETIILKKSENKNFKIKISKILNKKDYKNIVFSEIIGEKNRILVSFKRADKSKLYINNYLFNKKTLNYKKLDLNINILYSKKLNNKLIFITEKGSFIYSNKKIEYFSIFNDFIIRNGSYIGIVKDNDISRKKNFDFEDKKGDLIILKNPNKRVIKLLYNTDFEIKKILLEENQIILIDKNNKKFLLNFQ